MYPPPGPVPERSVLMPNVLSLECLIDYKETPPQGIIQRSHSEVSLRRVSGGVFLARAFEGSLSGAILGLPLEGSLWAVILRWALQASFRGIILG